MASRCGTPEGISRHRSDNEPPCKPCKALMEKLKAETAKPEANPGSPIVINVPRVRKKSKANGRKLQPCGTDGAYQRHKRHGEEPCDPCREAMRKKKAKLRVRNPRILKPCGTEAAYKRHKRNGEPIDEACREASRLKAIEARKARKEKRNEDQREESGSDAAVAA